MGLLPDSRVLARRLGGGDQAGHEGGRVDRAPAGGHVEAGCGGEARDRVLPLLPGTESLPWITSAIPALAPRGPSTW